MPETQVKDLSAEAVEQIVRRRFPALAPVRATYLGAGMDSLAFEVNERWVFRFPLRKEVETQLFVERAMLPVLAPVLPIAIPHFTFDGAAGDDCPFHFSGYEKLAGVSGTAVAPLHTDFSKLAGQLGPFLTVLHRFPAAEAVRLGTRTNRMEEDFEFVRKTALAELPAIRGCLAREEWERVGRFISSAPPIPAPPWPLTLTHNDLAAEHVLLDDSGSQITGVIDWGDVSIADPTIDFIGLFAWGGAPFVRAVLEHYDGVVDERVLDRARPWSMFRAVQDILFGIEHEQHEVVELAVRALERELQA